MGQNLFRILYRKSIERLAIRILDISNDKITYENKKNPETMKKLLTLIFVLAIAQYSFAQIGGSAHDFSNDTWNSTGEMCIVCHTPHNAITGTAVLWNHQATVASFTLYTSTTLDATVGQPAGNSKLCLSCHDGTVALENFGGVTTGTNTISGGALIGTDLSDDHPISFDYTTALATTDGGLFDPSTASSGLGGTIAADILFGNSMECATCHDVHNAAGNPSLLTITNAASALCLTCHSK